MNKFKKIMSVMLALCVILSAGSAFAFADETAETQDVPQEYTEQDDVAFGEIEFFVLSSGEDHIGEVVEDMYLANTTLANAVDKLEREIDVKGCGITKDNIFDVYKSFVENYPEFFYITTGCSYTYSQNSGEIINVYPKYITSTSDNYDNESQEEIDRQNEIIKQMRAEFDANIQQLMSCITPEMSDIDKLLALHDALACHTAYSKEYIGDYKNSIYTAYGTIVERRGVCQSYSMAYKLLTKLAGIEDVCIVGNELHGWNMVNLDGQWYHIDVTFDDPANDIYGRVNHNYFLISDEKLKENDTSDNHATWSPNYSATDTRYENESIVWNNSSSQIIYDGEYVYYCEITPLENSSRKTGTIKKAKINSSEDAEVLAVIDGAWKAEGGKFYIDNYTKMFKEGDFIYYNTSDSVIKVNVVDGTSETIYTLPDELKGSNNINGLAKSDSGIIIHYAASPTGDQTAADFEYTFTETEEPEPTPEYSKGDVDKNGVVDINDSTYIQKYVAGIINEIDISIADIDGDGEVSVNDATYLQMYLAGMITL